MRRCLEERELVAFHAGDRSDADREHLESCLVCARNYRDLQGDMETLLTALRRSPIANDVLHVRAGVPIWRRGARWALAASVVVVAFAGGRITGLTKSEQAAPAAEAPVNGLGNQIAMADAGARTPAGYGLYIDDLMDSDAADKDQQLADQGGADNQDSQTDDDSGAF
jgi:hypothetical protein